MKKLSGPERILRALKKHNGVDEAILARKLAKKVGLEERHVREIISDIVKEQEVLIASRVSDPCGFHLIKRASELRECLGQYKSRIDKLYERASSLYKAGLKKFSKDIQGEFNFYG